MMKLVDVPDSKSGVVHPTCRFDSGHRHFIINYRQFFILFCFSIRDNTLKRQKMNISGINFNKPGAYFVTPKPLNNSINSSLVEQFNQSTNLAHDTFAKMQTSTCIEKSVLEQCGLTKEQAQIARDVAKGTRDSILMPYYKFIGMDEIKQLVRKH